MAGIQDTWKYVEDFIGGGTFGTSGSAGDDWVITDTSSAGTPLYTRLDHGETAGVFRPGVARLVFDSQAEAQNVCLSFGDKLAFDIDAIQGYECGFRLVPGGTLKDATTTLAIGLAGDRNDAIDTMAIAALFRLASGSAVNTLVVESDDGTNNNDDIATGVILADDVWYKAKINFVGGKSNVEFSIGRADSGLGLTRVGSTTTFDMSNYSAGLQPFFQIQKTSDSNVDGVEIDYVTVWGNR